MLFSQALLHGSLLTCDPQELIAACVSGNMITVLAPFADKLWALLVAAADSASEACDEAKVCVCVCVCVCWPRKT